MRVETSNRWKIVVGKLILSINVSLDGFADHTVAVAADDEMHEFYSRLLDTTALALMGRRTYELMAGYWPHAHEDPAITPGVLDFAVKYNAARKIVFSRTLSSVDWTNTTIVRNNVIETVSALKSQTEGDISIGGISLAQECMRNLLVDEYYLAVHPIIAGTGRLLFDQRKEPIHLRLVDTEVFSSGVVVLHYLSANDDLL